MKYGLGVPFIERMFDLGFAGQRGQAAGFVGLIVADSFMNREFGSKLIESVLPKLDLTHVVDCSGACIPGHGTPTAILLGRNRPPVACVVRTVRGIRGEPSVPDDPACGLVWSAIVAQADLAESSSDFVSTEDTPRASLATHPWNMGGGGAADVQATIEKGRAFLASIASAIGVFGMTNADDVMLADRRTFERARCEKHVIRPLVIGDAIRDWNIATDDTAIFPYTNGNLVQINDVLRLSTGFGKPVLIWATEQRSRNAPTLQKAVHGGSGTRLHWAD
jgi:hypothetical protein